MARIGKLGGSRRRFTRLTTPKGCLAVSCIAYWEPLAPHKMAAPVNEPVVAVEGAVRGATAAAIVVCDVEFLVVVGAVFAFATSSTSSSSSPPPPPPPHPSPPPPPPPPSSEL